MTTIIPSKKVSLSIQALIAINLSCISSLTLGSANYLDLSIEQLLQTKIVSASKRIESVANTPAAVYVVTSDDISRSGITNIPDALRLVPGLDVAQSDSNSWAVSIRGFNSTLANKLLVLIDGRTVYNPVYGGVLWEAQELMLENIDRIEVIRGPGGTLWGANAVNGVINIITKHTRDTQGTMTSALYGDEEQSLNVRNGGAFGADNFYRVYSKFFNRDSTKTPEGEETYDQWDGARAGFRIDWDDQFTLQGDIYHNKTHQLKPQYSLTPPYAPIMNQTIIYQGADISASWAISYNDGSQLIFHTYIDWARRDEPYNFIDNRITYDTEVQYDFSPQGRHEIIVGAGVRYLDEHEEGNNNVSFSPSEPTRNFYNIFIQDKIALSPEKWYLTLGSKVEHNQFTGNEYQPNIRLQWFPNHTQTLWSAISHALRTPTPIEENLTSTLATAENVRVAFVPNRQFQSETLTAYEMGYRNQITSNIALDLAGFYNDYDKLETTTIESPYLVADETTSAYFLIPVKFTNQMRGTSHGIEAALSWEINDHAKVSLNYTYLNMSLTAEDPTQKGAELLFPENQLGLKFFANLNSQWIFSASAAYVDKVPGGNIDAYTRLDISVKGQLTKRVAISVTGQNLLDKTHREFGNPEDINAGEIERSFFGRIICTF